MEDEKKGYESYVVVHNIAKRHNVGTLARSCTAFGVSELILVGRRDFNAFGSHGSTAHVRFRHFHSLSEAKSFLKERDCDICGVEITDNALAVNEHPFRRSTAFLLGNECSWGSKPTPPGTSSTPMAPPAAAQMPGFSAADIVAYERQLALSKMGGAQALMHHQGQRLGAASQAIYDVGYPGIATTQPPMYYQ